VKYEYRFPVQIVPVPDGVTLINPDGTFETLKKDEVEADPRFAGRKVFPRKLAIEMVNAQRYDQGWFSGLMRRPGMIEVPTLPGKNQLPYFMRNSQGGCEFIFPTEPDGTSYALYKLFSVDATTGAFSYYEYDQAKQYLGPVKGIERVKKLPGYKWVQDVGDGGEVGDFRIIESVYCTRPDPQSGEPIPHWKYTITPRSYTGVVATAVVNPLTRETTIFHDDNPEVQRQQLLSWLRGGPAPDDAVEVQLPPDTGTPGEGDKERIERLERLLNQALREVEAMKNGK
jgi:hypothetical protein